MRKYLVVTKYADSITDLSDRIEHQNAVNSVVETLKAHKYKYKLVTADKITQKLINKFDLGIITVGGDGTALHVAKYLVGKHIQFFTINSLPNKSVGYLTKFTVSSFITTFLSNVHTYDTMYPLNVQIGRTKKYFTNDLLFSNKNPAAMSRYKLSIFSSGSGDEEVSSEIQASSGVWISSEIGATSAIKSAGFKTLLPNTPSNTACNVQTVLYKVREPYEIKNQYEHKEGAFFYNTIQLTALIPGMCVWLDGSYDRYELDVDQSIFVPSIMSWNEKYTMMTPKK